MLQYNLQSVRGHLMLPQRTGDLLHRFRSKGTISAGLVEGLNNKVKLATRKSYGFRTYEAVEIS